jgi:hypothetical protein
MSANGTCGCSTTTLSQQAGTAAAAPARPLVAAAWDWQRWLNRAMHDALAATVLLRAAVAVADHGTSAGLAQVRPQLATAASC